MTSTNPQPDEGQPRAEASPEASSRRIPRRWLMAGVGALALVLVAGGAVLARPAVTGLLGEEETAAAVTAAGAPTAPSAITLPQGKRYGTVELSRDGIAQLRKDLSRATAKAERSARLLAMPMPVRVAYFNMLGCYHTDAEEWGPVNAPGFARCSSRLPREFDWLSAHGISIAGVGEFQGKAWSLLSSYNARNPGWGIYPRGQSGPNGQNPVVWRTSEWDMLSGEQISIPYNNCGGRCSGRATSSLVLLQHRASKRQVWVFNTHHSADNGGFRVSARNIELDRIRSLKATGIPILYMGDYNEVGGAIGHINGTLDPAFGGMNIDQIWGTSDISFSGGGYDRSWRSMGLTDHGNGIALVTANIPGKQG